MKFIFTFFLFILISCNQKEKLFTKVPQNKSNIDFRNDLKENEKFNLVEYLYFYNGGGVASGDINNDGLLDIYISSNQGLNKLYLNQGELNFKEISKSSGVQSEGEWKTGVYMVDINGDGLLDIYQTRLGGYKNISGRNELFINNGDLTFSEKAKEYGLDFEGFSTHSAFFDYDSDGDLDMYLLNHSVHTERSYGNSNLRFNKSEKSGDRLFRNELDKGSFKFIDVSDQAGILGSNIGYGLGISVSDINRDGCDDIYISNDFRENDYLYINNCDGTFFESLESYIKYTSRFSMGNDISDINNDSYPDIMVLDMLPQDEKVLKSSAGEDSYEIYKMKLDFGFNKQFTKNTLQLNNGNNSFSEISQLLDIHATDWSWSTLIEDFDLDGNNDIYITNGIVKRPNDMDYISFLSNEEISGSLLQTPNLTNNDLLEKMPDGKVSNYAFKNESNLKFLDVSREWGLDYLGYSNGATYDDFDNDGDLDLIINNINDGAILYQNNSNNIDDINHIKINFEGNSHNIFGIGAKVTVWSNDKIYYKENFSNKGFMSSRSSGLIFGLAQSNKIDSLLVLWPSKKSQKLFSLSSNKTYTLKENEATYKPKNANNNQKIFNDLTDKIQLNYSHEENLFNDFNRERLIPYMISREGPAIAAADINGDNIIDIFIGSPSFQESHIFMGNKNGKFIKTEQKDLSEDYLSEDVDAIFFDIDNDKDLDLYVVSAGNELPQTANSLKDRLYINENNSFKRTKDLDQITQHNSVVINYDYNSDGYDDLFIGGRVISERYGDSPKSYLLKNQKNGTFKIDRIFEEIGMITDAKWEDINGDGLKDLITCGDWNNINLFYNDGKNLKRDSSFIGNDMFGWWFSIETADFNNDGRMDIIIGNQGNNTKLKPTENSLVKMYIDDFDNNSRVENIITYNRNGKEYPLANKDELTKELNYLRRDFFYYKDFAGLEIDEIFSNDVLSQSKVLFVNNFNSLVLLNKGSEFEPINLPLISQISPIRDIQTLDYNNDSMIDILLVGNNSNVSTYFGSFDSSYGILLEGKGDGTFNYINQKESGLNLKGDITKVLPLDKNKSKFVIGKNNDKISIIGLVDEK
tara:strand:- start:8257 stop:11526 length:3270 start_codon:yes stop_codon:yes gene_type:complete